MPRQEAPLPSWVLPEQARLIINLIARFYDGFRTICIDGVDVKIGSWSRLRSEIGFYNAGNISFLRYY